MDFTNKKRVAVIGAGASGLASIKSLKDEGLYPVCFEKTDHIGGVWKYHEEIIAGVPSMPWYTIMDHSKEMWAFSDFPPKDDLPNFMKHNEVYNYLSMYARHFNLLMHIQFNKEITKITKARTYDTDGKWTLTIIDVESKESVEEEFDGVLICAGHLWDPYIPNFVGLDKFQGKIMHTHDIKRVDEFSDKNVLVIGGGSSGFDAAVQISNVAKKVHLSVRDGRWIVPSTGPRGIPNDFYRFYQTYQYLLRIIPGKTIINCITQKFFNVKFNHDLYNLKPKQPLSTAIPVINDDVGFALCSGKVIIKKKVRNFRGHGIVFEENGTDTFVEIDTAIFATGYKWNCPFLDRGILDVNGNRFELYKCVFPPHLEQGTLAFIGFIRPNGPSFPIFEIQSRWASAVLTKRIKLPTRKLMMLDVSVRYDANMKRFSKDQWVSLITNCGSYMEDISSKIGAKPNWLKLLFDPKLFYAYFFGVSLPYLYRLQGPNSWPQAKKVILATSNRTNVSLGQKDCTSIQEQKTKRAAKPKWTIRKKISILLFIFVIYRTIKFARELRSNRQLQYYIVLKLFPYVNMVQQIIYNFRSRDV